MKATSQPNAFQIIMVFGVAGLFFLLLGSFLIFIVAPDYSSSKQIGLTIVGAGLYAAAIGAMITYFRAVPTVIITLDGIKIKYILKLEVIDVSEISSVKLNQKTDYRFLLFAMPIESTIVVLNDGSSRIFYDSMYEGFGKIKYALKLIIDPYREEKLKELRKKKLQIKPVESNELINEIFKNFKGTGIFNFYGFTLVGFVLFFIFSVELDKLPRILIFFPLVAGLIGYHLNYFRLSKNYFQIRNMIWFWKKKTYRLDDIQEIIIELPIRTPESVRIRLQNYYTSELHPAAGLRDKDWAELKIELEKYNIHVREK